MAPLRREPWKTWGVWTQTPGGSPSAFDKGWESQPEVRSPERQRHRTPSLAEWPTTATILSVKMNFNPDISALKTWNASEGRILDVVLSHRRVGTTSGPEMPRRHRSNEQFVKQQILRTVSAKKGDSNELLELTSEDSTKTRHRLKKKKNWKYHLSPRTLRMGEIPATFGRKFTLKWPTVAINSFGRKFTHPDP